MAPNSNPQHGAAVALVQLLHEFGDLPMLTWHFSNRENLAGGLSAGGMFPDPRPVVAAWADALNVAVSEVPFQYDGVPYVEFSLATVWRDVQVRICLSCPVSALTVSEVAA